MKRKKMVHLSCTLCLYVYIECVDMNIAPKSDGCCSAVLLLTMVREREREREADNVMTRKS